MAYPNEVYTTFSLFSLILVIIPLPWHLEAWNTGTCCFMLWAAALNLNFFVNSIVWNGQVLNFAPVWCDISTVIIVGTNVALPACSLCINRRLYHIATTNAVTVTRAEKRRAIIADFAICMGIPFLNMILHYIVQGHRFDIFEDIGCWPSTYVTWVTFVLIFSWPLAIAVVSGVYSVLTLISFNKRRRQFKELLSRNNNLNPNRYLRLMCLASVDVVFTIPVSIWSMANNVRLGVHPWVSWEVTHLKFSNVRLIPALLWKADPVQSINLEFTRWAIIACSILFFMFFGFADEARKNYRAAVSSVQKRVGYTSTGSMTLTGTGTGKSMTSSSNSTTMPVFVRRETHRKRDSLESFTDVASVRSEGRDFREKQFDQSFGTLSLSDVGGTLADTQSCPSSPASSFGSASCIESQYDKDEQPDIEISSLRYSIAPPEAAHLTKDTSGMV
ncbi:hypothetical protein E1B28_003489 [Marasmius oreades]|uniref:Pheromone receptor n=1 Tax=Marasmius oreades TaxID=181124 RepID=A0A9P7RLQ9_9AGAR|nr:uncharacterized protein E1B28_003489 [Marasmius oreades]KAG7085964.1 hypothetical protein E1B28_003489 [Marasmius oreades]